jgi:hypothetical protein
MKYKKHQNSKQLLFLNQIYRKKGERKQNIDLNFQSILLNHGIQINLMQKSDDLNNSMLNRIGQKVSKINMIIDLHAINEETK